MKTGITTTLLLFALLSSAAAAPITIDDFTTVQSLLSGADGIVDGGGILGGQRDVLNNNTAMSFTAAGGVGTVLADSTTDGFTLLTYDGDDASASINANLLGGVDLTDSSTNSRIVLNVLSVGGTADANIRIYSNALFSELSIPISAPGVVAYPFASLLGSADESNVTAIQIRVNLDPDENIKLSSVVADADLAAIPEPSTFALLGLGLCGLVVWRKRTQTR
jgi:PEP-CTERM motif-containing protein